MMTLHSTTVGEKTKERKTVQEPPATMFGDTGQGTKENTKVKHTPTKDARPNTTPTQHQAHIPPMPWTHNNPTSTPPTGKPMRCTSRHAEWRRHLLVRSGDIEVNPGPTEEEEKKKCGECKKTIRKGPGLLECCQCGVISHKQKKCSGSTKHELEKMNTTQWKCTQCKQGDDIREDGNADQEEEANQQAAKEPPANEHCRECNGYIKRGDNHLECVRCQKPCHKKSDCSGMSRDRIRLMKKDTWVCKECKDPETYAIQAARKSGAGRKAKCFICKKLIRSNDRRMECSTCKKETHIKETCSGETRKAIESIKMENWKCPRCIDVEKERLKRNNRKDNPDSSVQFVSSGTTTRDDIKVLQWNADSFASKRDEFREVIKKRKVDIFLIQETKMTQADKIPSIPGYTILSKPRNQPRGKEKARGGGLMIGIENTIPYREIKDTDIRDRCDGITEWQTIEIPLAKGDKWRITNLYIPSERAGDCRDSSKDSVVTTKYWPKDKNDMLAGDFNAHSIGWDNTMANSETTADARGLNIERWMQENDMVPLNSGERTHTNRKTNKEMAPDLTIVHEENTDLYHWEVIKDLGSSDHHPILITREIKGMDRVNTTIKTKWDLKNANWEALKQQVDDELPKDYERKNIQKVEKALRKIITAAANQHIGNKSNKRAGKPGYSKTVKESIAERNNLRTRVKEPGGRERWMEKCREVQEKIRKEKENNWHQYVEELDTKTNCRQVWNTIRNLDGRIAPRKENETLVVDGKGFTKDRDKANQFAKTYKKVSMIPKGPEDRTTKRQNREFLNNKPQEKSIYEENMTQEELERAIENAKNCKAPGEDTIPYEIIKQLGPTAKKVILHMYNAIWRGEPIPQAWRTAVIIPIHKEGKDPELTGSYRPISLTDCLGKILEKMIADRLSAYMEEKELFNECQAGFRQERCTGDQVWKLVQTATDKMQSRRDGGLATLVTFFDFERAYDKVWREGLIAKMIKLKVPYSFIKYARLFLSGRKTTVEINGQRSKTFYLNEGLPQGSAISPLLFLLFINDITEYMSPGATPSLFADDTAAYVECGKDKTEAVKKMQENINGIERWADEWKMRLNAGKTQVMVLSTSNADTSWKPKLYLGETQLEVVKEYKFLGITIDSGLRFTTHVNRVIAKARRRIKILKCLAGKEWGQSLDTQRALYITYIRSCLEYAAPSWYPWISKTARKSLETVQNECLRVMTRMAKTTPVDFLRLQAGIEPLESRVEKNNMIQWERFARLKPNDARKKLAEEEIKQRIASRAGWRTLTKNKMNHNLNRDIPKPHMNPMMQINATITGVELEKNKDEYTLQELATRTDLKVAEINADVEIYTDGSTSGEQKNGGAGVFAQDRTGQVLLEDWKAAGELCSSYDGECVAMKTALEWIEEDNRGEASYAIFSDSLSLTSALKSNSWNDKHEWLRCIKTLLNRNQKPITICWVPSHCNTHGNDKADRLADQGAKLNQDNAPVTMRITQAKIRSQSWKVTKERAKAIFGERRKPSKEESKWPPTIRHMYGRLRSGHAKELKDYRHRHLKLDVAGMCIHCDTDAQETIEHILVDCPQLGARRREIFEGAVVTPEMLTSHPDKCRRFLEARFDKMKWRKKVEDEGGGSH